MGKSRAEIQKSYRERQKAKGTQFLEKERLRSQQYYIPAASLNVRKLTERNKKAKLRNRLSRLRKKERLLQHEVSSETSGYGSMDVQHSPDDSENRPKHNTLIVKLPALQVTASSSKKSIGLKKTHKRSLARAKKTINSLESEVTLLKKKMKTRNKQIQRLKTKLHKGGRKINTQRKEIEREIENLSLTPKRKEAVKKKLLLGSAIMKEIEETKNTSKRKDRHILHNIVSGRITKKYRLLSEISKSTGLSRNSLIKSNYKKLEKKVESRRSLIKSIQSTVIEFLQGEDNSRIQPGKNDAMKIKTGEKMQTSVLTDNMINLHLKFRAENPDIKVSLASFCRIRPKHILLASFISRNSCQCIRHQNIALKIQSLKKVGINFNGNPENILQNIDDVESKLVSLPDQVPFRVWKRIPLDNGLQKMKIIEEVLEKEQFSVLFMKELAEFSEHVDCVRQQYAQLRLLKENLREHEMIVQMDFAENFSCRCLDEIQTAYWNQTAVTLHPIVVYYRERDVLKHKSIVIVSNETNHNASTVCTFIDALIPELKVIDESVEKVHYWTDSPSSQYRNRFVFHTVANHETKFGIKANWNYFEAGHGKGPCDGLGGTTKRMADEAIRQGKVTIQDAKEFFAWASNSNLKEVFFIFVDKQLCDKKKAELSKVSIKPVQNTMKLHSVAGVSDRTILTRITSCYCESCLDGTFCSSWQLAQLVKKERRHETTVQNVDLTHDTETIDSAVPFNSEGMQNGIQFQRDSFIACIYNKKWYVAQITDIDEEDDEVEVSFMEI